MPANRDVALGGIWAFGAEDPPGSPAQGNTYADSELTTEEIVAGWPFANIVDSAKFNEFMRRVSYLLFLLERNGLLPWSPDHSYEAGAWCLGSDGYMYQALVTTIGDDPKTSPTKWAARLLVHEQTLNPHGATSAATASRLMLRDANGRSKAAAPAASDDVARKAEVDTHEATRAGVGLHGVYAGAVANTSGTPSWIRAITGWTVAAGTNPGEVVVTHNLNSLLYVVVATPVQTGADVHLSTSLKAKGVNSFTVRVHNDGEDLGFSGQLRDFEFVLVRRAT